MTSRNLFAVGYLAAIKTRHLTTTHQKLRNKNNVVK